MQGFLRSSVLFLATLLISPLLATALHKSLIVCSFQASVWMWEHWIHNYISWAFPPGPLPSDIFYDAPMIFPPGSHLTGRASNFCCPRHSVQRMVRTPSLAEREPHNKGLWGPAAVHQWRGTHILFKDIELGNLRSALSMWLPAAAHLTFLPCYFWKSSLLLPSLPPPYPRTSSEAINQEARVTPRLADSVERKNMDILFSCAAFVNL